MLQICMYIHDILLFTSTLLIGLLQINFNLYIFFIQKNHLEQRICLWLKCDSILPLFILWKRGNIVNVCTQKHVSQKLQGSEVVSVFKFALYFIHDFCGFSRYILSIRYSMCMAKVVSTSIKLSFILLLLQKYYIWEILHWRMSSQFTLIGTKRCKNWLFGLFYTCEMCYVVVLTLCFDTKLYILRKNIIFERTLYFSPNYHCSKLIKYLKISQIYKFNIIFLEIHFEQIMISPQK